MRVFITGASGFLGRRVLNLALKAGLHVVAHYRTNASSDAVCSSNNIEYVVGDLRDLTPSDLQGCDAVFHFAATGISPRTASWHELAQVNIMSTLHLLQTSFLADVNQMVMAGSFIEYGSSAEDYDRIPPTAQLLPTTPYGASKAAAFELAYGFCATHDLSLRYLRIFSAFGEGQYEENLWPSLRKAALAGEDFELSSGDQVRDFIHADLVAAEFVGCLFRESSSGSATCIIENICSGQGTRVKDFAEYWWVKFGARGRLNIGGLPDRDEPTRFVGLPRSLSLPR